MAKANKPAAAEALARDVPAHGRTPDNTPIPGGGSWAWDAEAGAWVSNSPKPTEQE